MYLPSNTPLLKGQREHAACCQAKSALRVAATRRQMAEGRAGIFETIIAPEELAHEIGIGLAVNAQKLQDQTLAARASAFLGVDPEENHEATIAEMIAGAPTVVSLNRQPDQTGCSDIVFSQQLVGPDPTPSMPHGAPTIVRTEFGDMYFRGKDATYPGAYPSGMPLGSGQGLTGYNPPWSDAWVMPNGNGDGSSDVGVGGWIKEHPWWALAIAGAGVFALSKGTKGRRR